MRAFFLAMVFVTLCGPASAKTPPLNLDLAQDHVNITTGFTGSTLSVFGTRNARGDVVVILEGPEKKHIVRQKSQVLGAWINRAWREFKGVPSYYDYATHVPENKLRPFSVGLESLKGDVSVDARDRPFQDALVRNKQARGLFPLSAGKITFLDPAFFRVDFHLPANVPRGDYQVRALLLNRGRIAYETRHNMSVGQVGASAWVYKMAHKNAFLYGLLCVLVAFVSGWLSNVLVRR